MTTFVLVHGACHGAWCWNAVIAELERDGHTAVAVDLPSDHAELHLSDDIAVVHDALDRLDEPAMLVAHSLGAVTATAACHQRPVAGLVFVAGVVPVPGRALADLAEQDADRDGPLGEDDLVKFPDGTFVFAESAAPAPALPRLRPGAGQGGREPATAATLDVAGGLSGLRVAERADPLDRVRAGPHRQSTVVAPDRPRPSRRRA